MATLPKGAVGRREVPTFCRICEPLCGLVATVEGDELVQLRPDPDHPVSRGQACPKGIAFAQLQNDPDRVTRPLRRRPDGTFEPVSWDVALDDIAARLRAVVDRDGPSALGWYLGNPAYFSYSHFPWMKGFMDAIGSPNVWTASSQDVSSRFAANALLYGSALTIPMPDVTRTQMWVIFGGNPLVSHVTETNKHADYVLPTTTFLERDDQPFLSSALAATPYAQHADPVVAPRGEAREEWEIIDAIARRMGVVPASLAPVRWLGRLGIRLRPELLLDVVMRLSPVGDLYGLRRGGLSVGALRRTPSGRVLAEHVPAGNGRWRRFVAHRDKRVHVASPEIVSELQRLAAAPEDDPALPLRLIGVRELRSHNSWMHNLPKLMGARRPYQARIAPADAAAAGIEDGDPVRIVSRETAVETTAWVTDEMAPGNVGLPHGWGHDGGWQVANAAGRVNVNRLIAVDPVDEHIERVSGQSVLVGVAVPHAFEHPHVLLLSRCWLRSRRRRRKHHGGAPPPLGLAAQPGGLVSAACTRCGYRPCDESARPRPS
ncbi:MAG TPA: molybdopterin-dependent oxidoreductase [Baekduia sp.]|nr:molybdopterin-dependent oxidoreductase [Baekduia sp.]